MKNKQRYRFSENLDFNESQEKPFEKAGQFLLGAVGASVVLTIVAYLLFSLLFNTDKESRLKKEIVMYEKTFPQFEPQKELLVGSIAMLEKKDNDIYGTVFQSVAPQVDPANTMGSFNGSDSIADTKLISYTYEKAAALSRQSSEIESTFKSILSRISSPDFVAPPMQMPVHDITYPQIGAGQGLKVHPFLKVTVQHDGLDFIVPQGDPVFASAEGKVMMVEKSGKGFGNSITIAHQDGYSTFYAHLSSISVYQGQTVRRGMKIGTVGMSGTSYAPHLHYEVIKDGIKMNPVNYMFASITPKEYANMLYMSNNTRQSLD